MSIMGNVLVFIILWIKFVYLRYADAAWTLTGSSQFAVVGESFTLTCNPQDSNTGGVVWRRLDIDTGGSSTATVETTGCRVRNGADAQYQYTCEPGPIFKLTIPASVMTNSQNNKVWRCLNIFGGAQADYTLTVAVPVSSVSVQGDSGYPALNVIYENQPKTFTCITNGCRPKANIAVTTTGVTEVQRTETTQTTGDLIVTRVTQFISATRGNNGKSIQCSAVNIQGRQPVTSQTVTLDVYYVPNVEPTLSGYNTGTILYEGDNSITLTCQQSGGYPLSTITWSCVGQAGSDASSGSVASSIVQLTVNRNLNGKTCACTVRHPYITSYTRTKSVNFTVYYPPTTPVLQTSGSNFPWVENTQGVLKCITTLGNPRATTYKWIQNGQPFADQTTDTLTIPSLQSSHDGTRIQCSVSNDYTVQKPPALLSNTSVLNVQYTPIITLDTTSITVQEGSNVARPCSAIGNPAPAVKWYRGNTEQTTGTGTSATLTFSNIDKDNADTYTCKATATGKRNFESSQSVPIIVYYPPTVSVSITLQNATENATNVMFSCDASGFPSNYTYHGWTQYIKNNEVRKYTDFSGMLSESNRKITMSKVTFEDMGSYQCDAENGIQGRQPTVLQSGLSYFDVKASAKFSADTVLKKKGEIGKSCVISIPFYSHPAARWNDVKWINISNGNQISNSSLTYFELLSKPIDKAFHGKTITLSGQVAIMTIEILKIYHLGHYSIDVRNGGLQSKFNFEIITAAPPGPPKNIQVSEIKQNSLMFTWEKGNDGGYPQAFVILVKDITTGNVRTFQILDDIAKTYMSVEIDEIMSSKTYQISMYSTNENGNSSSISIMALVRSSSKEKDGDSAVVIVGSIIGVMLLALTSILLWRSGRCPLIKAKHSDGNGQTITNYNDVSQNEQDTTVYEGINSGNENNTREINTYESLQQGANVENTSTYQSLQSNTRSEDIPMDTLYENTSLNTR